MKKAGFLIIIIWFFVSCNTKDDDEKPVNTKTLAWYVNQFPDREIDILISCAASEPETNVDFGISVYFYPFAGAQDYRYYESSSPDINPKDFLEYTYIEKKTFPVFNGYLRRFQNPWNDQEKWVILTYLTDGKLHICDPIQLKQVSKPTLYASEKIEIELTSPTEPVFSWESDTDAENIIYFQVVSDSTGNLISGTYTTEKYWQFYDLSNVLLNITQPDPDPVLHPNNTYVFTMMGISEDNWVNLIGEKEFSTN